MFFFVILVSTKKFRLVQLEAKPNQNTRFTKFLEADRFLFLKIIFFKKPRKSNRSEKLNAHLELHQRHSTNASIFSGRGSSL